MPRQSAASLSIVPSIAQYAEPPAELSTAAADVWKSVIRTKPVEWFGPDTYPLLASYCALIVEHKAVLAALGCLDGEAIASDETLLKTYERVNRIVDQQRKTLALLATKMRLAQQSTYTEKRAATVSRKAASGGKPWE